MKPALSAMITALAVMLAGCATQVPWNGQTTSLRVGMSQSEVEAGLGAPSRTWAEADGGRVWVYERGSSDGVGGGSSQAITVRFAGDRVMGFDQSSSTTTTTTTVNP